MIVGRPWSNRSRGPGSRAIARAFRRMLSVMSDPERSPFRHPHQGKRDAAGVCDNRIGTLDDEQWVPLLRDMERGFVNLPRLHALGPCVPPAAE